MNELMQQIEREAAQAIERTEEIGRAGISGVSAVSEQVATLLPEMPAMPLAGLVPAPADVVRVSFDIAERLLATSRRIVESYTDAVAPIMATLMPWSEGKTASKRGDRKGAKAHGVLLHCCSRGFAGAW